MFRRLKQKRIFFLIAAFLLSGALGMTFAYSKNAIDFQNDFELGDAVQTYTEQFESPTAWTPCTITTKEATVTNTHGEPIRVRLSYDEFWKASDGVTDLSPTFVDDNDQTQRYAIIHFKNLNDWVDGNDGYYYYANSLAEGETTSSYFESVELNCDADFGDDNETCTETETGMICEHDTSAYADATYHLVVKFESVKDTDVFPNHYTITVNPNGGTYAGTTANSTYDKKQNEVFTLETATPPDNTHFFDHWEVIDETTGQGTPLSGNSFTVTGDTTIRAVWGNIVARNERTQKLYSSITAAEAEVKDTFVDSSLTCEERATTSDPCDTVTLLVDTAETVTNTKSYILNLGGNTVTGSITNNGDITLTNGRINNPSGVAVTNNGTLVMGVNDYNQTTGVALVDNNLIGLIGTSIGLKQNGTFNFYDGFIEGDVGLAGGYDAAPWYRDTQEDEDVYFFPLVDHIGNTSRQHVELANADRAVSKTKIGGDIYYYNLQDNINTSAETGYTIYAVRDFPATYPLTIPTEKTINFDIVGYQVGFQDTATINGAWNITDSETTKTRGDITYVGAINTQQTIINNGTLSLTDVKISGTNSNDTITNNNVVNMTSSILANSSGYVTHLANNKTWNLSDDSYLTATSSNTAVYVSSASEWTSGNITASSCAVQNNSTFTVSGGKISANNYGIRNGTVIIEGTGTVEGKATGSDNTYAVQGSTLTVRGHGKLLASSKNSAAYGYNGYNAVNISENAYVEAISTNHYASGITSSSINVSGGTITASTTASNSQANALQDNGYNSSFTITGGELTATATNGSSGAYGAYMNIGIHYVNASNTTITATSAGGQAVGIYSYDNDARNTQITISNTTISAHSTSGPAYGISDNSYGSNSKNTINSGTITGNSDTGTSVGLKGYINAINGGTITGGTYGIQTSNKTTLGNNDENVDINSPEIIGGSYGLYGGNIYFYDGRLKGVVNSYNGDIIKAIPDGTYVHTETIDGIENSWLKPTANYLRVGSTEYNSLTAAYDAVADGGTIEVIADASIITALPTNPSGKTIYFDLNGHDLTYTQSLANSGTMYITDSSQDHDGTLSNFTNPVFVNNGTLNIQNGTITSNSRTITNNSTLNISGGKVTSKTLSVYGGTVIIEGTGAIEVINSASSSTIYGTDHSNLTIRGNGQLIVKNTDSSNGNVEGNRYGSFSVSENGNVYAEASGTAYLQWYNSTNISGGRVEVISHNGNAYAAMDSGLTMSGGTLIVTAAGNNGSAYGAYTGRLATQSTGGTIDVSSINGTAVGLYSYGNEYYHTTNINVSNMTITAHSDNGSAYAIYNNCGGTSYTNEVNVTTSTLTATSDTGSATGLNTYNGSVKSSTVSGTTYGVVARNNVTIGEKVGSTLDINSPEIIGGTTGARGGNISFFGGRLKGGTDSYNTGAIKAIPDGATIHTETINNVENSWLVNAANYLRVGQDEFNSLTLAYDAVADGGTIEVINDASIITALPTNPSGKTIYFDLNGHTITYTQSLTNSGTMYIVDNSQDADGVLQNTTNATIVNNGTLNIQSGTVAGTTSRTITNNGTITISGGKVTSPNMSIYGGTVIVEGTGTIEVISSANNTSIYGLSHSDTTVRGNGQIIVKNLGSSNSNAEVSNWGNLTVSENGHVYGEASNSIQIQDYDSLTISGGLVEAISHNGDAYGAISAGLTMTGGTLSVTAAGNNGSAFGASMSGSSYASITNATLNVSSINGTAAGLRSGAGESYYSTNYTVAGTTAIAAHSDNGTAYGIYNRNWGNTSMVTMTGGTITADSDTGTAIGVYTYDSNITGGTITGDTYGLQTARTSTIGTDDGTYDNTKPIIIGDDYGAYAGNINFYSGIIKGGINAFDNIDNVKAIAAGATVFIDSETIGGENYEINYLVAEYDVAKIGSTKYKKLSDAIDAAGTGDTIELIADNYIFYRLTIPSGKNITIETAGYNIVTGNQITNNGDVKIINSNTQSTPTFIFRGSAYYLTNANNASLELEKLAIQSASIVSSSSTLSIKDSTLTSTNIAVNSTGSLTLDNVNVTSTNNAIQSSGSLTISNGSTIAGNSNAVYVSGGTVDIDDSALTGGTVYYQNGSGITSTIDGSTMNGYINIQSGNTTITDTTIARTASESELYLNNAGNLTFDDVQVDYTSLKLYGSDRTTKAIQNSGTMAVTNNSTINFTISGYSSGNLHGIYNAGSSFTMSDSSLDINLSQVTYERYSGYGLYNGSGAATLTNSSVSINRTTTNYVVYNTSGTIDIHGGHFTTSDGATGYGIYNDTGTVTLGEPEDPTSADYGKATAHVDTQIPEVSAYGSSNGYGVVFNSGRFNFYDGRISATTAPLNKDPSNAEYKYEACTYTNTSTTPNTFYSILVWMIDGQHACSNN